MKENKPSNKLPTPECEAHYCTNAVQPPRVFCEKHWKLLPLTTCTLLFDAYPPPSADWQIALGRARRDIEQACR